MRIKNSFSIFQRIIMELDGLVKQVLTGLDSTHPVKPEPVSDLDATNKSMDDIFNSITTPSPEDPAPQEQILDKLINELKSTITPNAPEKDQASSQDPFGDKNPFGDQEDWGEERY